MRQRRCLEILDISIVTFNSRPAAHAFATYRMSINTFPAVVSSVWHLRHVVAVVVNVVVVDIVIIVVVFDVFPS